MVTSLIPMNGTKSLQWCSDSNPQYLGVESASLTTRPRLIALFSHSQCFRFGQCQPSLISTIQFVFRAKKTQHFYGKSSAFETIRMLAIKSKKKVEISFMVEHIKVCNKM
jgi:hypothetical protein